MIGHFRKKSLFFRDTRDNQEYDAKNRLSIPSPSPEKLVAEIARLKKTDLTPNMHRVGSYFAIFNRKNLFDGKT